MEWIWINWSLKLQLSTMSPQAQRRLELRRIQSYIIVDTKDAGDSVKISIDQQLLRMLGYELSIHHSRDDCEDLRGIQSQFLRSITQLL